MTMISRRVALRGGLAGAAALAGSAAVLARSRAYGDGVTLPLTVVNSTGTYANSAIWLYLVGNTDGRQVYARSDGTVADVSLSDNAADGYTDYAIPLAASGDTSLTLPGMSGRLYVALGEKLKFKAVTDGNGNPALQYPAGWTSSDPNYSIVHDFAEFTLNDSGMYCNTTMVDMFSVPMSLRLTGSADQTTGTLAEGGRDQIFSDLSANSAFAPLIVGDSLRVIAPGHGLDAGLFAGDYFASSIDQVWNTYASTDLRVTTSAGTFTGRVSGGTLAFSGPASVSFAKPSTRDVLFCDGALAAPNDGTTGPVAAVLGAGFNRSTLHSHPDQPTTDASAFYTTSVTNHYAKAMHRATANGKAYGFAFDDVADFASYIQDTSPTRLTLTLTAF